MGTLKVPGPGELPKSSDVVVIGGGVIGCASAFYLSSAGHDTTVIERRAILGSLTTAASEECFRAQFAEPENIRMMLESISIFERFADEVRSPGLDIGIRQQGYLFLTGTEEGARALDERVAIQRAAGLSDVELLGPEELRKRFPFVGPQATAATYRARDGWLSAHELTQGFAAASSAVFCLQTAAASIACDAQGVCAVETNRGKISTRCVVIAAGPFSAVVGRMAGVSLPLTLLRRQKAVISDVATVPRDAPMTIDADTGAYWRPESGGAALGWALPEPPSEPSEHVPADWTFPAVVLEGVSRLVPFWVHVAEHLTRERVFLGAGQYTMTPDSKPIIGPSADHQGLYYNVGYSGHGIMGSAAGARLLARLVDHPGEDAHNAFSIHRLLQPQAPPVEERLVI